MSGELLRSRDVAKIFGISVKTLWKWQRRGIPESERLMGFVKPDVSRKAVIYVRVSQKQKGDLESSVA